jgi:hypothetical protein
MDIQITAHGHWQTKDALSPHIREQAHLTQFQQQVAGTMLLFRSIFTHHKPVERLLRLQPQLRRETYLLATPTVRQQHQQEHMFITPTEAQVYGQLEHQEHTGQPIPQEHRVPILLQGRQQSQQHTRILTRQVEFLLITPILCRITAYTLTPTLLVSPIPVLLVWNCLIYPHIKWFTSTEGQLDFTPNFCYYKHTRRLPIWLRFMAPMPIGQSSG